MARHRWDPICPPPRGLVTPVRIDPRGVAGPTRRQAGGRYWRRTSPGLFVPVDTDSSVVEQRIVEVAARLPSQAVVTGWAACRLQRATFFDGLARDGRTELPVPVAIGRKGRVRDQDGRMSVRFHDVPEHERATRFGIPTVTAVRATYDAMWSSSSREAVVALDMMCAAETVSLQRMRAQLAPYPAMLRLADVASEHSRSPNETRLRLVWELDAGLPRPMVNCAVHGLDGELLGVADLLDEEAGVVVEYDGADHRTAGRHTKDVAKDARLRRAGLDVIRVTGLDLDDHDLVVDRLVTGRAGGKFVPLDRRQWVARPAPDNLHERILEREASAELNERLYGAPTAS